MEVSLKNVFERLARKTFLRRFTYAALSYSQCGEDLIVSYIFSLRGIDRPSYLDIGAHHPYYLNNTALFYHRGSRGINIEPDPELAREFVKSRPDDINLNIGIAAEAGFKDFHWMEDRTFSTFSSAEAQEHLGNGQKLLKTTRLPVVPLMDVISRHASGRFPDFLTIDVEGLELELLGQMDLSTSRPKVICLETAEYSPEGRGAKRTDLIQLVESKNYLLYADTNLNSIYVDPAFWNGSSPSKPDRTR